MTLLSSILRRVFRGRFAVTDAELGIPGRDGLNHVAIILDGPQHQWEEKLS